MSIDNPPSPAPSYVGPFDPLAPVGDIEIIANLDGGTLVRRREFSDGWVYEVVILRGAGFHALRLVGESIPKGGVWMNVYNPQDCGEMDSEALHLTVWVSREGIP